MIFKSQNSDLTFKLIFGSVYLFLFGIGIFGYFQTNNFNEFIAPFLICVAILLLSVLIYYRLKISIDGHFLTVNCFINLYKTDIRNITKIRKGETLWSGIHKYGTRTKGLIIFSKFKNDLYITPENEELFLQKILEINPGIVIERVSNQ